MKKLVKGVFAFIFVLIILLVVFLAGYAIWLKSTSLKIDSFVPDNFAFYANIEDPAETFSLLDKSGVLETIRSEASVKNVYEYYQKLRSAIKKRPYLKYLANVSTTAAYYKNGSFLLALDTGFKTIFVRAGLYAFENVIADSSKFSFEKITFEKESIVKLRLLEEGTDVYFIHKNNIFIVSPNFSLIKECIKSYKEGKGVNRNSTFVSLKKETGSVSLVNVYSSSSFLLRDLSGTSPKLYKTLKMLNPGLMCLSLADVSSEGIEIKLFQSLNPTNSMINEYLNSSFRRSKAGVVLPISTSNYACLTFSKFEKVWEMLKETFKGSDTESYLKTAEKKIKELTGLDLKEWLFSWIRNEAGVGMLEDETDPFIVINCTDVSKPIEYFKKLNIGAVSVSPDTFKYKEVNVNQVALPPGMLGLARLFVPSLRLPYYFTIDNYLIITQSRRVVSKIIDAYKDNKVLYYDKRYKRLTKRVEYEGMLITYWDLNKKHFKVLASNNIVFKLFKKYSAGIVAVSFSEGILKQHIYLEGKSKKRSAALLSPFPLREAGITGQAFLFDIDDDNIAELIYATKRGVIKVLDTRGNAKPGFENIATKGRLLANITPFKYRGSAYIAAADYDGNIYLWDKNGRFMEEFSGKKIEGHVRADLTVADINADDIPDIIVATAEGKVYAIDLNGNVLDNFPVNVKKGIYLKPLVAGISDSDKKEIVVVPRSFSGEIYVIGPDGKIKDYNFKTGFLNVSPPACFDIDDDGNNEIIISSRNGKVFAFNKKGTLSSFPLKLDAQVANAPAIVKIDGKPCVAFLSTSGGIYIISSKGKILKTINTSVSPSKTTSLGYLKIADKEFFLFAGANKRIIFASLNGNINKKLKLYGSSWVIASDADKDGYTELLSYAYDRKIYFYRILNTDD